MLGPYPREAFASIGRSSEIEKRDIDRFVRLWLTEGIPFCFQQAPIRFELIREYIASKLSVDEKDISMCGSGRLGFSLSPYKILRTFEPGSSDLDLFVVSPSLFSSLIDEYDRGMAYYKRNLPQLSEKIRKKTEDNAKTVNRTRQRGFIDTNKVPVFRPVWIPETTLKCEVVLKNLDQALRREEIPPPFKRTKGIRIYRSWGAAIKQNAISVSKAIEAIRNDLRSPTSAPHTPPPSA